MTPVAFNDLTGLHREIREELDRAWCEALETSGFVGGPAVERFEASWARYCGVGHAVGVANGTDALELVLAGLGIGHGDEVIVPANTFVATAEAIVAVGARPRFVDVDPATCLVTPTLVSEAITARTAAVVVVHLYGNMPDMTGIAAVCDAAGVALVEDAAQAHGATHLGRPAGSWGVAGTFSFYPGKNLGALGDGGAVTTDDAGLAARLRSAANHGRSPDDSARHDRLGRNSRLDALQAAVLTAKLEHLDAWNERRRVAAARYEARLPPALFRYTVPAETTPVFHLFVVELPNRDQIRRALDEHDVATGLHYPIPCHRQPAFTTFADGPLPVVEQKASRLMSLPMHPRLGDTDVDRVCNVLASVVNA